MTTSTKDLIKQSTVLAGALRKVYLNVPAQALESAAQRMRELDKPDCVWTSTKVADLDCFKPACTNAFMYFDLEKKHFCPNCGGAVKSGGLANDN